MKQRLTLALLILWSIATFATHNRAGEITYTWLGGRTYEVVITTYTQQSAVADRCELTIDWGDFSSSTLYRENGNPGLCPAPARMGQSLGNDVQLNIYRGTHTYQSPGFYTLSMYDENRNIGTANIPNSIQVPFYISTVLNVNPALGSNTSPQLLNPPIDDGCRNQKFIHNPGAWDPDGDSLGYELVNCRGFNGLEIPETYDPAYVQDPVTIDPVTGDFVWNVPKNTGQYNFAILITEYRKGLNGQYQVIGQITRDMQVTITNCNNQPPVIPPLGPFCVEVGQNLSFAVQASDPDNDPITLTATGGPLEVAPVAQFAQPTNGVGVVQQFFGWTPACVHVQKQPWTMSFKVEDDPSQPTQPNLVDYMQVEITVIAPAPENLQAVPNNQGAIDLSWNKSICDNAIGYHIYRREGFYGYTPDSCETGVPAYTGYSYLASTSGHLDTTFVDSLNLKRGMKYCYMVTAYFADEAESRASEEACTELKKSAPIITHVDVLSTSTTTGEIEIKWVSPHEIDTFSFPPPYSYGLERAENIDGTNFTQIATLPNFADTSFIDQNLNTEERGYSYRVVLYSGQNQVEAGVSDRGSSVFLSIFPFDSENRLRMNVAVPWQNHTYVIYRENTSGTFDSIATSNTAFYNDTGLTNGDTYCYYAKAIGSYSGDNLPNPLINHSQIACAVPLDTTPPCAPVLDFVADCENGTLTLSWTNPSGEFCSNDITSYSIYYKPTQNSEWPSTPLISGINPADSNYTYSGKSIVGCYAVTATDDGTPPNESELSNHICIEGCPVIELPNVFSPNGSPPNNFFRPVLDANGNPKFKDIESFKIEVFNRWGTPVYQSEDESDFVENGWDGKDMKTGQDVPDGVYFYLFTYTPKSITETNEKLLKGTVTIFR